MESGRAGKSQRMGEDAPALSVVPGSKVDEAVFRELFSTHYGFVRRAMLGFGVPSAIAEDATQEVFVVVHRRVAEFDGRTTMRAWLYGIARRVAHTMTRGEYRASRKRAALSTVERERPDLEHDLERELVRRRAADRVGAFLESLAPAQREVFALCDIEGLRAPEVAAALGVNLNTVYSRLRLARRRFERFVRAWESEENG